MAVKLMKYDRNKNKVWPENKWSMSYKKYKKPGIIENKERNCERIIVNEICQEKQMKYVCLNNWGSWQNKWRMIR